MRLTVAILLLAGLPVSAIAQTADLTYWQDIRPICRRHCTGCHSSKNAGKVEVSGGLALDTFEGIKKGTKRPVVTPGKSDKSLLHDLLVTKDVKIRMPLDSDPLPKDK